MQWMEALTGHANQICVTVYEDGSLSVEDNGRGMLSRYSS